MSSPAPATLTRRLRRRLATHVDVLYGLGLLALLGWTVALWSSAEHLLCTRDQNAAVTCEKQTITVAGKQTRIALARPGAIRDIRLDKVRCGKVSAMGIVLVDSIGHEKTVMGCGLDEAIVRDAFTRLRRFMDDPSAKDVTIESTSKNGTVVLAAFAIAGFALWLVVKGLRASPLPVPQESGDGHPAIASRPIVSRRRRLARVLFNRNIPRLLLIVVGGLILAVPAFRLAEWYDHRGRGRLDVNCIHSCRMGGMTCLPGGSISMYRDPGDYTLEVWAPDKSPKWQPVHYSIGVDRITHVDCLPP